MGWRPLLWTFNGTIFGFATEPRALVVGLGMERRLNEGAIGEFLASRFASQTDTFWQGISRLPQGASTTSSGTRARRFARSPRPSRSWSLRSRSSTSKAGQVTSAGPRSLAGAQTTSSAGGRRPGSPRARAATSTGSQRRRERQWPRPRRVATAEPPPSDARSRARHSGRRRAAGRRLPPRAPTSPVRRSAPVGRSRSSRGPSVFFILRT